MVPIVNPASIDQYAARTVGQDCEPLVWTHQINNSRNRSIILGFGQGRQSLAAQPFADQAQTWNKEQGSGVERHIDRSLFKQISPNGRLVQTEGVARAKHTV